MTHPRTQRLANVPGYRGAIDEASPGGLVLTTVAMSQTDNAVQNSANVSTTARQGVSAEFDPASAELPASGCGCAIPAASGRCPQSDPPSHAEAL